MNIEEALKDVYERRAELTPSVDRVREAVAARVPLRARPAGRRIALMAAAAAALVAVPVVVAVSLSDSARTSQVTPVTTSTEPTRNGPVMRLQPTWLPDGLVETERGWGFPPDATSLSRKWTNQANQSSVSVSFTSGSEFSQATNAKPMQVNGKPGQMIELGVPNHAWITWQMSPGEMAHINVTLIPDAMAVALRVADSIKLAELATSPPIQFGWLPDGVKPDGARSSADNGKDVFTSAGLTATNAPGLAVLTIAPQRLDQALVGPREPVTVFGKPGLYVPEKGSGGGQQQLVVQINETHWLSLIVRPAGYRVSVSKEEMIRIVDSVKIGDLAFGWVGKRGLPN